MLDITFHGHGFQLYWNLSTLDRRVDVIKHPHWTCYHETKFSFSFTLSKSMVIHWNRSFVPLCSKDFTAGHIGSWENWSQSVMPSHIILNVSCEMFYIYVGVWRDCSIINLHLESCSFFHLNFFRVRYLIASHTTDYQHPMLFLNTIAVIVLVIAKFPNMHKVRIFGINADKWV